MQDRDLWKGGVAAVLLAALVLTVAILPAEYGLDPTGLGGALGFTKLSDPPAGPTVRTGDGSNDLYTLRAEWRLYEIPVAERGGFFERDGESARFVLPLNVTNLTTVTATLEWVDDEAVEGETTAPDLFDVRILTPDRRSTPYVSGTNEPGGAGNATAEFAWRTVPFPVEDHEEGVLIPIEEADESGIGNWTVLVRMLRAGGTSEGAEDDPGTAWRLRVVAEAYEADVQRATGRATDEVTLTLPAGSGIEYKFRMDEGDTLDYVWTSTAAVYWDLHAERPGADPDDATSFATGTSGGEEGTHTAPFDGTHGWFWHNRGSTAVTITLETRGTYEILGVP